EPVEPRLERLARAGAGTGTPDGLVDGLVDRRTPLLDDAVGVEHEHVLRRQLDDLRAAGGYADAEQGAALELQRPAAEGADEQRREVPRAGQLDLPGAGVDGGDEHG